MTPSSSKKDLLATALGESLFDKVHKAKILVVGAGGIGCELIKNLVLSGFQDIHVIDLDTIDVSNLNRQFLFRSHHVGQSKALVAKEIALKFNPSAKITAHHGNIKSSEFGPDYFSQFALVMNALDNLDARKHVNRLCLATKTPLIESGTTGYLGQVSVIQKGETECYECTDKAAQKVYPICTIRSTPEKMVHCIVWAKECYKLLFGNTSESMLWEDPSNEDKSAFMDLVTRPDDQIEKFAQLEACQKYAQGVFRGLFEYEIKKKLEIKAYKGASRIPKPLELHTLVDAQMLEIIGDKSEQKKGGSDWNDREIWTIQQCAEHFLSCIVQMLLSNETRANLGSFAFDKDDAIAMEFVTAAANLRAAVFGIAMESMYSCKGIAGNIIPAIATTNAIVAGIQVLEAFKIIRGDGPISSTCKYTYCNRAWDSRGVLLNPVELSKPNPKCFVCSKQILELAIDTKMSTLRDFVDKVLKKRLGVNEPTVSIGASTIYEEGEDASESLKKHLDKKLVDLPGKGIQHDTVVSIEDFSQEFQCSIRVLHKETSEFGEEAVEFFALGGDIAALETQRKQAEAEAANNRTDGQDQTADHSNDQEDSDDDVQLLDDDEEVLFVGELKPEEASGGYDHGIKRKAEHASEPTSRSKRRKPAA